MASHIKRAIHHLIDIVPFKPVEERLMTEIILDSAVLMDFQINYSKITMKRLTYYLKIIFLTKQSVYFNDIPSDYKCSNASVFQGSVLGLLLFLKHR